MNYATRVLRSAVAIVSILVTWGVASAGDREPTRGASPVEERAPRSAPVINEISQTERGYIISGQHFGTNRRALVVIEENRPVSAKLIRSVSDTKIEVLSKPAGKVSISVRIGRAQSRPVAFAFRAERSTEREAARPRDVAPVERSPTRRSPSRQTEADVPARNPQREPARGRDGAPAGSDEATILIRSFEAVPDVASGRAQVRLEFQTRNADATAYRAVLLDNSNQDAPFDGVPWKSYRGGTPILASGCGTSALAAKRVALQVRGLDIPNPNLPNQTIENISAIRHATYTLPESLQSRITSTLGFGGAGYGQTELDETSRGDTQLGAQTAGQVVSYLVTVENHPGGLDEDDVKSASHNCFEVTAVGPVTEKTGGKQEFSMDGIFDFSKQSCRPAIVVGECGISDARFHTRSFPDSFEQVTTVYQQTKDIETKLTISAPSNQLGCEEIVEQDGDLSFATSSPGPLTMGCFSSMKLQLDDAISEQWILTFKSESSGQCGLGPTFLNELAVAAVQAHPIYSQLLNRQSDLHWAYDKVPPRVLEPDDLDGAVASPGYVLQHSCGLTGGTIRTWVDKAVHKAFVKQ
jgi:hypothetical protein